MDRLGYLNFIKFNINFPTVYVLHICIVHIVQKLYLLNSYIMCSKRNPLFLHEIEWKNNGFLFTTPNICYHYSTESFQKYFRNILIKR